MTVSSIILLYIVIAVLVYFSVSKNVEEETGQETALVVSVFWPVVLLYGVLWEIVRWVRKNFDNWMY